MRMEGSALLIRQDDVDTDVLYPGTYLNITDVEAMKPHLFEGLDPSLRDRVGAGTVLVVGENFGSGSSREHVPQAMKAFGIQFLVGKSFARIFARNCMNLGLPVITCAEAVDAAHDGSRISADLDEGELGVDEARFSVPPLPPFMRALVGAGGLVPWVHGQLDATTEVV
jgi:3-isopropylmalate/(R)-2-methylmalate dehydratase small subunit